MKWLIKKLVEIRKTTLFLALVVCLIGLYTYYMLPRQQSPELSPPIAMIVTPYPGASPNDVKDLVTKKIEDKLVSLDGYDYCSGTSKESLSVVVIFFENSADYDKSIQAVRNAVADAKSELPEGCLPSQLITDLSEATGIIISLSGENYSYEQLSSFGELFKDKLENINGITKVSLKGKLDNQVKITIDSEKLNQIGLSLDEICRLLKAQNIQIPSGSIKYNGNKITVNTPGTFTSTNDIKNTIIAVSEKTGQTLTLKDIADIHMGIEDDAQKFKQDGKNAVILVGYFEKNKNIILVGNQVRKEINLVKGNLPSDLIIKEVVYQPDDVSNKTNEFMLHLVIGIILVIVVVFLGMGARNAVIASTAIPLSILSTFIVMYITGIQIHQVSLVGLIISLGILVDDAIVVADSIQVRINQGEDRVKAAYLGAQRCIIPILTATISIILSFCPFLFMDGPAGRFMRAIPLVIITSIIASYFTAMFITPAFSALFFKKSNEKHNKRSIARKFFQDMLRLCLRFRKATIVCTFAALLIAIKVVIPHIPLQFFPYVTSNILYIDMTSEKFDINSTENIADKASKILKSVPEIESCLESVGKDIPKFYVTMPIASPSSNYAQIACQFNLKSKRFKSNTELANYLQKLLDDNFSEATFRVRLLEYAKPVDAKVIIRVSGKNRDNIKNVALVLEKEMSKMDTVTNVRDDCSDETLELKVDIDEDKASSLGISKYDVQAQINIALYGSKPSVYRKDSKEYSILVKSDIKDVSMLENFKIKSSITGKKIPLKEFALVSYNSKLDTIKTYNKDQTITVMADPAPGSNAASIENYIEANILPKLDSSGTKITLAGEREEIKSYFSIVGLLAVFAAFMIYIMLLLQFNSFTQPLVIMVSILLSLIGSTLGLYIFRQPLSLTAFLGIIALIGLVVKNGILLIDFINAARKEGIPLYDACIQSVDKRYNAVILTALTVIVALIPLAVSGNNLFSPMAVSLMSGLTFSTFFTMVVIPVVYYVIESGIEKRKC
ncbi:MAG: efflux RND transporter permease subunit [Ignavibacteriales bacterium]